MFASIPILNWFTEKFYTFMITMSVVMFLITISNKKIRDLYLKNQNYLKSGKTILITGGCMGIGKEMIKILINKFKCKIINVDLRDDLFDSLNEIVEDKANKIQNYKCDLSNFEELNKTLNEVFTKNPKIDILINNAAIAFNDFIYNLNQKQILKSIDVNLASPLLVTKLFLNEMEKHDKEIHVVNIASNLSHVVSRKSVPYIASKFGLFGMHEAIRYGKVFNKLF